MHVKKKDEISVSLFNTLQGIDKDTLKIVNEKISDVKEQSQNKILKLAQALDELQIKLSKYEKLDSSLHALLNLKIEDLFNTLPQIQSDIEIVFPLFVQAYNESALLPIIQREYGSKLAFD